MLVRLARRSFAASFVFSSFAFIAGCSASAVDASTAAPAESEDAITDVQHTAVERQSIGNCWIYAESTWLESMHKAATGEDFDTSQSYLTYWHWFDQIVDGSATGSLQTGGWWSTANDIIRKRGVVSEKDFVALDSSTEMSARQKEALDTINASLTSGVLSKAANRRDPAKVRAEMDKAWKLTPEVQGYMTKAFGPTLKKTFSARVANDKAVSDGTPVVAASKFAVAYTKGPGKAPVQTTLEQAMGEWRSAYYGGNSRAFHQRVQRALHDRQPVLISWHVDFNALDDSQGPLRGSFNLKTLKSRGPGNQGGHMTVLEDYQAKLANGTVLAAGVTLDPSKAEDKAKLDAALASGSSVEFYRVKNSWGSARPDRPFSPGMPGYHDLYMDYLDGPIKQCAEGADGHTDPTNCEYDMTPLNEMILPPGY